VKVAAEASEFTLTLEAAGDAVPVAGLANAVLAFRLGDKNAAGAPVRLSVKGLAKQGAPTTRRGEAFDEGRGLCRESRRASGQAGPYTSRSRRKAVRPAAAKSAYRGTRGSAG